MAIIREDNVYRTSLDGVDEPRQQFSSRWTEERTLAVRLAISGNSALPQIFDPLHVHFAGRELVLDDLRGIDLAGLEIGAYDLAYCALDHANLSNCTFNGTSLQYSRLVNASFNHARLSYIQASPIDARCADFSSSSLVGCFISNSDFESAILRGNSIIRCDLSQSNISLPANALLSKAETGRAVLKQYFEQFAQTATDMHVEAGEFSQKALKKVGAVVSVSNGTSTSTVKVMVLSKGKSTTAGRMIVKPMKHVAKPGGEILSVGQTVEIEKVKSPGLIKKNIRRRFGRTGKYAYQRLMREKDQWHVTSVDAAPNLFATMQNPEVHLLRRRDS